MIEHGDAARCVYKAYESYFYGSFSRYYDRLEHIVHLELREEARNRTANKTESGMRAKSTRNAYSHELDGTSEGGAGGALGHAVWAMRRALLWSVRSLTLSLHSL